jgi:hypothetical protein
VVLSIQDIHKEGATIKAWAVEQHTQLHRRREGGEEEEKTGENLQSHLWDRNQDSKTGIIACM